MLPRRNEIKGCRLQPPATGDTMKKTSGSRAQGGARCDRSQQQRHREGGMVVLVGWREARAGDRVADLAELLAHGDGVKSAAGWLGAKSLRRKVELRHRSRLADVPGRSAAAIADVLASSWPSNFAARCPDLRCRTASKRLLDPVVPPQRNDLC